LELRHPKLDLGSRLCKKSSVYKDSKIKILDLKSICKLKLVALLQRDKSRDLFDFIAILDNKILTLEEILDIRFLAKLDPKSSLG